uniref:hypothetical protein n=1 Tax=Nosocomiicoccus ampullae TaxID=489910 RepID=UPI000835F21E|nr:hypothetical protein [Nosocomiicoccus ampullae]
MWSILVDFVKDFYTKNKKLKVEANQIHTKLVTFMERQSWRVQLYDNIYNLWSDRRSELIDAEKCSLDSIDLALNSEVSKKSLLNNENIIRIYLQIQRTNFREDVQQEMFEIYEYENWAMHLSKEELDLCKWIYKYMKDLEEVFVYCHELFFECFEEKPRLNKNIIVTEFLSYLTIIKGAQEYSIRLFYQEANEEISKLFNKIDKKAEASPQLLEVYNETRDNLMIHLKRVKDREYSKRKNYNS